MPDLYELLAKKKPIFVTNHSQGTILLELRREGHKSTYEVKIPPIKDHPIDLGKLIPYPIMQYDHSTLFTWIRKDLLRLHDPDQVEASYKANPELARAVDEVVSKSNKRDGFTPKDLGFTTAPGSTERAKEFFNKDIDAEITAAVGREKKASPVEAGEVSLTIKQMVATLQEDPALQQEMLAQFRVLNSELLTKANLGYVIKECKKFSSVAKWAKGVLAKKDPETENSDEE